METEPIKTKFESYPAIYWAKMLRARARKEAFNEPEPPTNWKDNVTYYMKEIKNYFANLAKKGKETIMSSKDKPVTNTNVADTKLTTPSGKTIYNYDEKPIIT